MPDCHVTKCHSLCLTPRLEAMREKMGKRNKREGDQRKGGSIWSAKGGNKHVQPLPGRHPMYQGDLESKVQAIQVILGLDPLAS